MTGPEHYREAEGAANRARTLLHELELGVTDGRRALVIPEVTAQLAYAQVHATLAVAAASVVTAMGEGGSQTENRADWYQVVHVDRSTT